MIGGGMVAWLKRILPSLLLDALLVLALAFPDACTYLRWPFLGCYLLLTWRVYKELVQHPWFLAIARDPAMRVAHGLEHATLAVLLEDGMPALHGFTYTRNRFVVALEARYGREVAAVREAAVRAIRRIREGERALAYQPGCSTSQLVSMVSLWLVGAICPLLALALGGASSVFFAIGLIVFRLWLACETSLGLLAQRLFTVSTDFTSATVVNVRETRMRATLVRPHDEVWFEIVVDVCFPASEGGIVAPGAAPTA